MRKIIIFLLSFIFLSFLGIYKFPAHAELPGIRDIFQTIVGAGGSGGNDITSWAEQISAGLEDNCPTGTIYNRQQHTYTNGYYTAKIRPGTCGSGAGTYFCTNIVMDSYILARLATDFCGSCQAVYYLARNWESKGWTVLKTNDQSSLSQLRPGDAIFMGRGANAMDIDPSHADHHTVVISSIYIDSAGNGSIKIAQSNGGTKFPNSVPYGIHNWKITSCFLNDCPTDWWFGLYPR